ncbi:MAG: long-chain fatty acid--CoA ligase [Candidatus Omnitrophica bacterium]|nr:long-chain fatty acid--CoA ligase [Candidatus Omnitrophota bacterium]
MIPKNLPEILRNSAAKHPFHSAIVFGSKKISYHSLNEITDQLAEGLISLGIKKQENIAIFLDNCPEFIISYYAILKAGAVVVPVNYMFKIDEARHILRDSEAVAVITSASYVSFVRDIRRDLPLFRHIFLTKDFHAIRRHHTDAIKQVSPEPNDQAVILYTSGTTGLPKGAVLSHYNLVSNATDSLEAIRISHKDALICVLPLFHSFAATVCMNTPILAGSKIVIMKSLKSFKRIIRAIRKNKVTVFPGIPSIFNILKDIKLPKIMQTPLIKVFNPVRICISGAAALPKQTLKAFESKFRIPLLEGYGLTEASPVVTLNPLRGTRIAGSIGPPLSRNIELKVVDDAGGELGPEQIGELIVRGSNVMLGYFKQPETTKETIRNGWLYTGDMAKIDNKGYAYIVGRKKEMINVRGQNVYPREIEEVLHQNPRIKEAAVIGIEDIHKGEVPKAFVVLKEGEKATEQEVIHYLRERLAGYKIPKQVEFRNALPKNTTGKILKRVLTDEEKRGK